MTAARARRRPRTPVVCRCPRVRHEHGTMPMYRRHDCGCDDCYAAYRAEQHPRSAAARAEAAAQAATPTEGLFVATFVYFGGYTRPHLERVLRPAMAALAEAQGVQLQAGDLRVRVDWVGTGNRALVVVALPAVSSRPVAEVRERAAALEAEHEQAHPRLARWINEQLEVAA